MKKLLSIISMMALVLGLTACGSDEGPLDVYAKFSQEMTKMSDVSDNSINQYLTKRAAQKKQQGFTAFNKIPEAKKAAFGEMALKMFKQSVNWVDPKTGKLEINGDTASLSKQSSKQVGSATETTLSRIKFVNEGGWKVDQFLKETKSVDGDKKSNFSEQIF